MIWQIIIWQRDSQNLPDSKITCSGNSLRWRHHSSRMSQRVAMWSILTRSSWIYRLQTQWFIKIHLYNTCHMILICWNLWFFFISSDILSSFKEILPLTRRRSIIFLGNPHGVSRFKTVGCIPSIEVVNSEVADGAHLRDVNHFEAADEILQDEKTQGNEKNGVFWSLVNFGKIFFWWQ